MKTLTVRLPEALVGEIAAESRVRKISKSDVVRERLRRATTSEPDPLGSIADLIGCVDRLPSDLSARKKRYLKVTGYGKTRRRR